MEEVKRHLKNYVDNELFKGQQPPSITRKRFHPTANDIRNILNAQRSGNRKAVDDQENLYLKCEEWKEQHPQDSIFFRVMLKFFSFRELD